MNGGGNGIGEDRKRGEYNCFNAYRNIKKLSHKLINNSMEMDEHWFACAQSKRDKEVIYLKYKTESALRYASLGKIPKFDVLFSGTRLLLHLPLFLVLVAWLPFGQFSCCSNIIMCQLNFDILLSHQQHTTERTRKFYPIYELQFIFAFGFCRSFYTNTYAVYCVQGVLKFVVNGFLMQIL